MIYYIFVLGIPPKHLTQNINIIKRTKTFRNYFSKESVIRTFDFFFFFSIYIANYSKFYYSNILHVVLIQYIIIKTIHNLELFERYRINLRHWKKLKKIGIYIQNKLKVENNFFYEIFLKNTSLSQDTEYTFPLKNHVILEIIAEVIVNAWKHFWMGICLN